MSIQQETSNESNRTIKHKTMKIKHVYGNVLRIDIPLTIKIRTIEEGAPSEREEPFYPDASKGCIVELANNYNRKIEYNATITDNIVHIEDIGKISIGQYKVTVKCYDASGNPYRYMVRDIVEICDATADAGIEAGVEFNAETYTLEGAVFVSYGVEQVQADWEEDDDTSKAFIKNKPSIYTQTETDAHITQQVQAERERAEYAEQALGQAIGTKQDAINDLQEIRQGAQLGATAIQEEQDPTVPQWAKATNKPSYNANEVGALPSTTKYGSTIDMVLNNTTYVLTLTLKDQDGNSLNSKSVDLPLESVVVDGRYDATSKKIILTLQSGSTLDIPVGDLVAGLQTEITSTNMLDADLVDDTNSTHKFVTLQEKTNWNNKSDFSGSYNDLTDKPVIPVVPTNVSAFNNDAGYLTQHQDISGKVDKVEGKGLSTNDYTDEEKEKLAGLENYDDTQVRQLINEEKAARQQGDNALSESVTQEETRAKSVEQTLQLAIDTINGKIPAQATSQNQLADKEFVNSSISTATADFKGTYNSFQDLEQVVANANDYAFVIATDAAGNTVYKRYKWVEVTGWVFEYDLNNSSFTAAQWAAIQSGITAALVTKLSDLPDNNTLNQRITQAIAAALLNYYTKSEIDTALGNKQDAIQDLPAIRSGAQSGSTAVQPDDEDYTELQEQVAYLNDNAVRTGSYDATVAVGLADNLRGDTIVSAEFYKRKTGGTQSVGSGIAAIKEIRGKSIVWNQLVQNGNMLTSQYWGEYKSTIAHYDGYYRVAPKPTGDAWIYQQNVFVSSNHKYFVTARVKSTSTKIFQFSNWLANFGNFTIPANTWTTISIIISNPSISSINRLCVVGHSLANDDYYDVTDVMCIDLTLMFGAGNEPTTAEELEKIFPLNYYGYNTGEIIPFAGQNLVTIGKNQYNPATGKANLLGSHTYQIGGTLTSAIIDGVAVTLDGNNCFTAIKDCVLDVTGGNDTDTIVALYNGEDNTYAPYEKHTLPLDPSQWRDTDGNLVFPYGGMHGVGTVYDYAKADADGYIYKAVRLIERRAYESGDTELTNVVTDGSTYTFYPLETPVEATLATPVYAKYLVDKDGTEEITPANGSTPYTAMANISSLYAMDARGTIQNLPKNYLSKEKGEEMFNVIGRTGVISQTQTWASDFSSYTMSDIVIGIIPQAAIDLYEEAGATFNKNGYQTGIGYFEMNGITDLSYQNIKDAYDFSYHNNGQWVNYNTTGGYVALLPRTNFPLCNGINFNSGVASMNRSISLHLYYLNGPIEVLRLSRIINEGYGASVSQYSGYFFFSNGKSLREVMGVMNLYNITSVVMMGYIFSDAPNLKTAKFHDLRFDWSLKNSSVLSLDSVVYMVRNSANTSAITITLHPDVYAVCQADTTEYTYQGNTYTGIIALATARNITIATA